MPAYGDKSGGRNVDEPGTGDDELEDLNPEDVEDLEPDEYALRVLGGYGRRMGTTSIST